MAHWAAVAPEKKNLKQLRRLQCLMMLLNEPSASNCLIRSLAAGYGHTVRNVPVSRIQFLYAKNLM